MLTLFGLTYIKTKQHNRLRDLLFLASLSAASLRMTRSEACERPLKERKVIQGILLLELLF